MGEQIAAMGPQARTALAIAAERIGASQYDAQRAEHARKGRSPRTMRYVPTAAHRAVVEALGSWTMTDAEAYALLWEHDVMAQRLAGPSTARRVDDDPAYRATMRDAGRGDMLR